MGERPARRRRVLIEDARGNDRHLRATWHPETRQFVVSTWIGDTCTGAARLPAEAVAELTGLLVDGLSEAVAAPAVVVRPVAPPTRTGWSGLLDRLRWLAVGTPLPQDPTTETEGTLAQGLPTLPSARPRHRRSA
jgi:hypothetical protein